MTQIVFDPVRSPIRGEATSEPPVPPKGSLQPTALTATSGAAVTASLGNNAIAVPSDFRS